MADAWRNYRNRQTGLVQRLHPRVAATDSNFVEVADDAKPLAYTPIPQEAVEDYLASTIDEISEPDGDVDEDEEPA
jgi:lysyl-tRNA synthetase class I